MRLQDGVGLRVLKVGLSITPEGVITAFCLAEASADERPIGDFLIREDGHEAYLLADKGFSYGSAGSVIGQKTTEL